MGEDAVMELQNRHLVVERQGDVWCARLAAPRLVEGQLDELAEEFARMINDAGCRKLVLSLGPQGPECLYSVFLARLVSLQRRMQAAGGALKLADLSPEAKEIFTVCNLDKLFEFAPTTAAAVAALRED
jgi:hypothetical protein